MVRFTINNNTTKLTGDTEALRSLYNHLKFKHPNAYHMKKRIGYNWDGYVYPLTKTGVLKTGMVQTALDYLVEELEIEDYEIVDHRKHLEVGNIPTEIGPMAMSGKYAYQKRVIETVIYNSFLDQPHSRGIVLASMNAGKCSCEGTLLSIRGRGLVPIELVTPLDDALTEYGFKEVLAQEYTGYIRTIKLQTHHGYKFEGGYDNHRLKVFSGEWRWGYLKDFKVGDLIPLRIGANVQGGFKKIQGVWVEESIAYFLGAIHGDGSLTRVGNKAHLSITANITGIHILEKMEKVIDTYFPRIKEGTEPYNIGPKNYEPDNYTLRCGRTTFSTFILNFPELFGGAFNKRIPRIIFESPLGIQQAYLRGYFDTDGSVDSTRSKVSLTSVSDKGTQDTLQLLLNLGVVCRYDLKKTSWQGGKKSTTNRIQISGYNLVTFKHQVGFEVPYKAKRLAEIEPIRTNRRGKNYTHKDWDSFPFRVMLAELLQLATDTGLEVKGHGWGRLLRMGNSLSRYIVREQLGEWSILEGDPLYGRVKELNSYHWDTVESLQESEANTWDIEVKDTHSYISNGLISHNTPIMFGIHMSIKNAKTIILLNNSVLYKQMKKDLIEIFPDTHGYMQGKSIKWGDVMVVMVQTLNNRLKEYSSRLAEYNVLLTDECDLAANKTFETVYKALQHISFRMGFTGTAFLRFLKKDAIRNTKMLEIFGSLVYTISMKELEDRDVSTPIIVKLIPGNKRMFEGLTFKEEWDECITYNKKRHKQILKRVLFNVHSHRRYIMIFCKFIAQVEETHRYLAKHAEGRFTVDYAHHKSDHGPVIEAFEVGTLNVLVCSLFLKRGLNLPLINTIINAAGGDFYSAPLQIAGRGVRKHASKQVVYLEDMQDKGVYLSKHSRQRIKYYQQQKLKLRDLT